MRPSGIIPEKLIPDLLRGCGHQGRIVWATAYDVDTDAFRSKPVGPGAGEGAHISRCGSVNAISFGPDVARAGADQHDRPAGLPEIVRTCAANFGRSPAELQSMRPSETSMIRTSSHPQRAGGEAVFPAHDGRQVALAGEAAGKCDLCQGQRSVDDQCTGLVEAKSGEVLVRARSRSTPERAKQLARRKPDQRGRSSSLTPSVICACM